MPSVEEAQEYLTAVAVAHKGALDNLKKRIEVLEAETAALALERDEALARERDAVGRRDIALGQAGEARDALAALQTETTDRINAMHQTNQMLAERDKTSRDEHTRLRAIITAQNTKGNK